MTAGEIDVRVIIRHLAALREALQVLSKHSDTPIENLESDPNERWGGRTRPAFVCTELA